MTESSKRSPVLPTLLSALIPGLGHGILHRWYRGVAILLSILVVAGMVAWYGKPIWYAALAVIWLWNIWDAFTLANKARTRSILVPILAGLIAAYGIGWQVVGINFASADMQRALSVAAP
jgi:lysylphosphatidylglycerol synthetase-like protein (DUF2156 family)